MTIVSVLIYVVVSFPMAWIVFWNVTNVSKLILFVFIFFGIFSIVGEQNWKKK